MSTGRVCAQRIYKHTWTHSEELRCHPCPLFAAEQYVPQSVAHIHQSSQYALVHSALFGLKQPTTELQSALRHFKWSNNFTEVVAN